MFVSYKKNSVFKRSIAVAILFFVCGSVGFFTNLASAAEKKGLYLLSLSPEQVAALTSRGYNLTPRFTFSDSIAFSQLYTGFFTQDELAKAEAMFGVSISSQKISELKTALDAKIVNDPGFTLNALDIDRQWGLIKARFPHAWSKVQGSSKVKVAIIDTGIDETHEDLKGASFLPGYNVLNRTTISVGSNSDDNGHGTLVAGVLAAVPNNSIGIAGAAFPVSIIPIKALSSNGEGSSVDVAEAIVWATDSGAQIINMSMGGLGFAHDTVLANSISYAFSRGVVIVAAAGNDVASTGGNLDEQSVFPVCDDNGDNMVIGVAATDQSDLKADFSNYGKACVDVMAPGKRILSVINYDPISGKVSPNAYAYASGTSMAAPFVTGLAVLLRAQYPLASNSQIRDQIIKTADSIDALNISQCKGSSCAGFLGSGRINAETALTQNLVNDAIKEGDVVSVVGTGNLYYINGGKKQLISSFVKNQRFSTVTVKTVTEQDLDLYPEGTYASPLDGTLIKGVNDPTVYFISKGLKLPITAQIFSLYGFSFNNVATVTYSEIASWVTGSLLVPPEGTLVKSSNNPTVFWVVSGVLHPISASFYESRGLKVFPILLLPVNQLNTMSKGEAYF